MALALERTLALQEPADEVMRGGVAAVGTT